MYKVAVLREFIAQHYLIGGDWGPENDLNSHQYRLEITIENEELDQHGYLVDIVEVENVINDIVSTYKDNTLNDFPEFENLNPSLENFCRIIGDMFCKSLSVADVYSVEVRLWEDSLAWASHTRILK
ncbi:MAG: 6-carboxytetrahydropterin synthase [Chloroflexota bacterium]|nr:6-carboxytetrahydropterin synthase [Chloroflexota bacterium]|tara:strand:+ start:25351 stop:25731 length:381 start_codon:yes stop_codon:yes gene_type:complete